MPGSVAVYFTDLPNSGYTSALAVSPRDHVFLWAPPAINQLVVPVSRPAENQFQWTQRLEESKSSKTKFRRDLAAAGVSIKDLPYGCLAYLAPDSGRDELWSSERAPLWPGWFRAYAFPTMPGAREAFARGLQTWLERARPFGLRKVPEPDVISELTDTPGSATARDADLFWSEPQSSSPPAYRHEYARILNALTDAILRAERGEPLSIDGLTAGFQIERCRLYLLDHGVKDERRRLSEAVGKYRAHLIRLLRWPVFVELAAAEILSQERFGRVLPAYGSEPTPYDGWAELQAYLDDMRVSYREFFSDPLEEMYVAGRAAR